MPPMFSFEDETGDGRKTRYYHTMYMPGVSIMESSSLTSSSTFTSSGFPTNFSFETKLQKINTIKIIYIHEKCLKTKLTTAILKMSNIYKDICEWGFPSWRFGGRCQRLIFLLAKISNFDSLIYARHNISHVHVKYKCFQVIQVHKT